MAAAIEAVAAHQGARSPAPSAASGCAGGAVRSGAEAVPVIGLGTLALDGREGVVVSDPRRRPRRLVCPRCGCLGRAGPATIAVSVGAGGTSKSPRPACSSSAICAVFRPGCERWRA